MLIDQNTLFSSAQVITAAAISSNIIDLKGTVSKPGVGARPLYVVAQVTTAFTDSSNNSSVVVYLQTDAASNMASPTNAQTIGTFATNSAIGTQLIVPITSSAAEQYLALYYDVAGGDLSAGAVTAFITPDPQLYTAYAVGYSGPATA